MWGAFCEDFVEILLRCNGTAEPFKVFLEFARHQLEEGDDDPDDERVTATKKTHALMRQVSVHSGNGSASGSRATSPAHQHTATHDIRL